MSVLDFLTESIAAWAPSGNPLDLLTLPQFFVFTAHAHGRSIIEIAVALGISRQVAYEHLDKATERLRPVVSRERPASGPSGGVPDTFRSYSCAEHSRRCPPECPRLKAFMRDFDRAYPTEDR